MDHAPGCGRGNYAGAGRRVAAIFGRADACGERCGPAPARVFPRTLDSPRRLLPDVVAAGVCVFLLPLRAAPRISRRQGRTVVSFSASVLVPLAGGCEVVRAPHKAADNHVMSAIYFLNRYFHPDHSATSQMLSDVAFDL